MLDIGQVLENASCGILASDFTEMAPKTERRPYTAALLKGGLRGHKTEVGFADQSLSAEPHRFHGHDCGSLSPSRAPGGSILSLPFPSLESRGYNPLCLAAYRS